MHARLQDYWLPAGIVGHGRYPGRREYLDDLGVRRGEEDSHICRGSARERKWGQRGSEFKTPNPLDPAFLASDLMFRSLMQWINGT